MNKPLTFLLTCLFVFSIVCNSLGQSKLLGKIEFPNSGAEKAQADFIEGVLFLHNFEYADAARAFRRAQEKDPDFAMAYWGEAMTYNHPIWMQQDREAAIQVLNKLAPTPEARQAKANTQREKDYLYTLEVLYGNTPESRGKSKEERDFLYRDAMKKLHETYPDDHEANAFYGLSILGTAHDGRDFAIYMKAAAELLNVWNENQKHPGAVHYLIHSFDDPIHAPLGLPMAKAYAEIAPAAAHAQHMTSHIFLALGMWEDVIDANIVARDVQTTRQKELDERTTVCGHYPWWLQYGYLQTGEVDRAEEVLTKCYERIKGSPDSGELWHFAVMRAHQIIDTENWKLADRWKTDYEYESDSRGSLNYYYASALSALQRGNLKTAKQNLKKIRKVPQSAERDIQIKQLEGLLMIEEGDTDKGLALLEEAATAEFELPIDFGPPAIVKPSSELLGDIFMKLGNFEEARQAYQKQLDRTPKRRLSLLGLEKSAQMAAN